MKGVFRKLHVRGQILAAGHIVDGVPLLIAALCLPFPQKGGRRIPGARQGSGHQQGHGKQGRFSAPLPLHKKHRGAAAEHQQHGGETGQPPGKLNGSQHGKGCLLQLHPGKQICGHQKGRHRQNQAASCQTTETAFLLFPFPHHKYPGHQHQPQNQSQANAGRKGIGRGVPPHKGRKKLSQGNGAVQQTVLLENCIGRHMLPQHVVPKGHQEPQIYKHRTHRRLAKGQKPLLLKDPADKNHADQH